MKCVHVQFPGNAFRDYSYMCKFDNVKAGDHAIVDTPTEGYKVVKVVRVLEQPDKAAVKQVVQLVDDRDYRAVKEKEDRKKEVVKALEAKLKEYQKNELFEFLAAYDNHAAELVKQLKQI